MVADFFFTYNRNLVMKTFASANTSLMASLVDLKVLGAHRVISDVGNLSQDIKMKGS